MVFDVMIKDSVKNSQGKQVVFVYRVNGTALSAYLREAQDNGKYIIAAIPLYPVKRDREEDMNGSHVGELMTGEDIDEYVQDRMK